VRNANEALNADFARVAKLRERMAAVIGVDEKNILPVRGLAHALALFAGVVQRDGGMQIAAPSSPVIDRICRLAKLGRIDTAGDATTAILLQSPGPTTTVRSADAVEAIADAHPQALIFIDESLIESSGKPSIAQSATRRSSVMLFRQIAFVDGGAAAMCAAIIATPALIARIADDLEPDFLPSVMIEAAMTQLAPQRVAAMEWRAKSFCEERRRLIALLRGVGGCAVDDSDGPAVFVRLRDPQQVIVRARRLHAPIASAQGGLIIEIRDRMTNDRSLMAFGAVVDGRPPRIGEAQRETKETKIAARVDLDGAGDVSISTGIGFFDHMLEQIASHAGFSLRLSCEGDRHVDPHHTIEDCALALGTALSNALGDRRGVARYGFTLPMDEALAEVSIDLGGRPFCEFKGRFAAPLLGEYPTEMTAHVFRSLAQTLGAAIHVSVTGENDHHKTEAAFKALARAMRAAIAIESDGIPSTKGVI